MCIRAHKTTSSIHASNDAHTFVVSSRLAPRHVPEACQNALVSVLSNLDELCADDSGLAEALRHAEVVTDGGGEAARISDLFDPAVSELKVLLSPEAFPAEIFCTGPVRVFYVLFFFPKHLKHEFPPPPHPFLRVQECVDFVSEKCRFEHFAAYFDRRNSEDRHHLSLTPCHPPR